MGNENSIGMFRLKSFLITFQKGLLHFQQSVELRSVSWEQFPDGWPNLFIENVRQDCAGRDGKNSRKNKPLSC